VGSKSFAASPIATISSPTENRRHLVTDDQLAWSISAAWNARSI
jgi:hypothetical protein